MQLTPEIKAQLEQQKQQCVFCKLISGEMEAKTVFEDKKTMAMLDIYPAVKGHLLYLPKEHYPLMPYLPPEEFQHFFGILPELLKAVKEGMAAPAMNVLISNGGVAGQQASHFSVHILPRDDGDGFYNFLFDENKQLNADQLNILQRNFPMLMGNHFQKNPAGWHQGAGEMPRFLKDISKKNQVIYEDEKVLAVIIQPGAAPGQMRIYSKTEERDAYKLSAEDMTHLFYAASYAASLLFEGLKAQGTNILLRSGYTDDNRLGRLCIDILPRKEGDAFQGMFWKQKQPSYNIDDVKSRIKEHTWKIGMKQQRKKAAAEPRKIIAQEKKTGRHEIKDAIERLKG